MAFPYVRHIVACRGSLFIVIRRVHRQSQLIHAVAVVHRLQAVPQDIRASRGRDCHIGVAFPYVWLIVTRRFNRFEEIGRIQFNGQVHHAVALVLAGEHHQIGALGSEQAVTILQRQFRRADVLDIGRGRIRIHNERDNDCAVAGVHRRIMNCIITSLIQRLISIIDIRKFVGTSIDRIIMQVSGIHIQRQSGDHVTAVGEGLHHIIDTSFHEQGILILERQGIVADGHLVRMAFERNHIESHIDNAVTAMGCIEMDGTLGILRELYCIVEDIRQSSLTRFYLHIFHIRRMNGQMEGHDAVATILGVKLSHIITRLIIHIIVERDHITLTNLLVHILMISRVYCQGQLEYAITVVHCLQAVPNHVLARRRRNRHIRVTVPCVWHIVARDSRHLAVVSGIHRQGQFIDAIATGDGLQRIEIDTGGLIRTSAPLVRQFVAAHDILHRNQAGRIHRQGQLKDAVATVHGMQTIPKDIAARRGRNRHAGMSFPNVRSIVTRGGNRLLIIGRIHRKVKVHEAIAPVDCSQHNRINACSGIFNIIIRIDITLANRHIHIVTIGRIHRKGQHTHTVAALRSLQTAHHRMRTHCRWQGIETMQLIRLTQADGVNKRNLIHRFHRQCQEHRAVATEAGGHMPLIRECARYVSCQIGEAIFIIRNILTNLISQIRGIQRMHRQSQNHNTIAIVGSNKILDVESSGIFLESVQRIGFILTDIGIYGIAVFGSHRQIQCDNAIAAVHRGKRIHVCASHIQDSSIEIEGSRLANRGADIPAINGVHRQLQRGGAVAASYIGIVMNEIINIRHGNCSIKTITLITGFGTHHILIVHIAAVEDGRMQRHRAVATVNRIEMLHVVTCSSIGFIIPGIRIAGLLGERFRQ